MPRKIVEKKKIKAKGKPPLTKPVKLWLKALRSGKFDKGVGRLEESPGKYCCLGVACIVFEKETGRSFSRLLDKRLFGSALEGEMADVRTWLGLRTPGGSVCHGIGLINLNDDHKLSFKKIADVIESKPEGLFITDKKEKTK